MSERDMVQLPLPEAPSKQLEFMSRIDNAITDAFRTIRHLHELIKKRCIGDELSEEALINLLRASWAVENSQKCGRQTVVNQDKQSYKSFINTMKGIIFNTKLIIKKCVPYEPIPFHLVAEAMLFGGDIIVITRNYK